MPKNNQSHQTEYTTKINDDCFLVSRKSIRLNIIVNNQCSCHTRTVVVVNNMQEQKHLLIRQVALALTNLCRYTLQRLIQQDTRGP